MKYITKVDSVHVIECNGINHQILEAPSQHSSDKTLRFHYGQIVINRDLTIRSMNYDTHLAPIVLAIEMTRFILQQDTIQAGVKS